MDIPHEIIDEDGDMVLDYPAAITINAPAGIAQLYVDVVSPALNALEIGRLDLFNETQLPIGINYSDLGLNCTTQIQYQKSTLFDITRLVPMIPLLKDGLGSLVYGDHTFNVTDVDLRAHGNPALIFRCNRVDCSASDLWATRTLSTYAVDPQARSVVVKYRGGRRFRMARADGLGRRRRQRDVESRHHGGQCLEPGDEPERTHDIHSRFRRRHLRAKEL